MRSRAESFVIPARPGFSLKRTVPSHGWIMLAPFRWDASDETLRYVVQTRAGDVLRLQIREADGDLRVDLPDLQRLDISLQAELTRVVRRMLNMDWDLQPFYQAMREHADYAWIEQQGLGRILISPSLWEDLAKVLLTTNTSWAQTVSMSERLCRLGAAHPTLDGCHAFPSARRIASMTVNEMGQAIKAGYRTAYLHELARKISAAEIDLDRWLKLESGDFCAAVKTLNGFGEYAARSIACMYGRFDKFGIDSGCRAMFARLHNAGEKADDKTIAAWYARFGDWRGLVQWMDNMRYFSIEA